MGATAHPMPKRVGAPDATNILMRVSWRIIRLRHGDPPLSRRYSRPCRRDPQQCPGAPSDDPLTVKENSQSMTESQSKLSPALLLVHGTWAQHAAWTRRRHARAPSCNSYSLACSGCFRCCTCIRMADPKLFTYDQERRPPGYGARKGEIRDHQGRPVGRLVLIATAGRLLEARARPIWAGAIRIRSQGSVAKAIRRQAA